MIIACVTHHSYPTPQEIRVTRLAAVFSNRGDTVLVFCPGTANQPSIEAFEYGQVLRFAAFRFGLLGRILRAAVPVNPLWLLWLYRCLRKRAADLVIVRDLRLAVPAIFAARLLGIKAILDLGEHYPGMVDVLGKQKLGHYLSRNRTLIAALERYAVGLADLVWVVAEENRQRLRSYARQIEVINNYPMPDVSDASFRARIRSGDFKQRPFRVVSFGILDNIRGLDLAVEAINLLKRDGLQVEFDIFGDGDFRPELEERVRRLELQDCVRFYGYTDPKDRSRLLASGDVGLILHKPCDLTQHTIPNKLFDYMYVGLPILCTKLRPVVRIVEREGCGIAVDYTPEAVADGLTRMMRDPESCMRMSEAGFMAARSRYVWDLEVAKVCSDVDGLFSSPG